MTILALDLSPLVGWAIGPDIGGARDFRGLLHDYGRLQWEFGKWLADTLAEPSYRIRAVVIEKPVWRGSNSFLHMAMFGQAMALAYGHECLRMECHPATLKKWATGDGRADKAAMIAEAERRGYRPWNDDHADACLLLDWAAEQLRERAAA